MAGNVFEWVADWYDEDYYAESPDENPQGHLAPQGGGKVVRGGDWYYDSLFAKTTYRLNSYGVTVTSNGTGFRCALSP
jgi:formylglycine-generating enzyme required for sulfatase activity